MINNEEAQGSPEPKPKEDDLEEGELPDDDDDDDDEMEEAKQPEKSCSSSSSSSASSSSPASPSSSSSSESQSRSQSKRSSREGSHSGTAKPQLTVLRQSDEGFLTSKSRDKHDPSNKAAKLISMRTALLEARSREIEMKFQKNKTKISKPPTTQQPLTLLTTLPSANLKMTIAKPSISYSENPNPPKALSSPDEKEKEPQEELKKSKQKRAQRAKKSKKKSKKKKKKVSPKKHKKRKSESTSRRSASVESKSSEPLGLELPYETNIDHQGPRTPPDNHVNTIDDEQVEWPSHLIRMTVTQPSISYSVNPDSVLDASQGERSTLKRRKSSASSPSKRIKNGDRDNSQSISPKTSSPFYYRRPSGSQKPESVLDDDYDWYVDYFIESYEMDPSQAQHQAFVTMLSNNKYETEVLEKWLQQRGYSIEDQSAKKSLTNSTSPPLNQTDSTIAIKNEADQEAAEGSKIPIVVTRLARNQVNRDVDDIEHNDIVIKTEHDVLSNERVEATVESEETRISEQDANNKDSTDAPDDAKSSFQSPVNGVEPNSVAPPPIPASSDDKNTLTLRPIQPKFTTLKLQRRLVLPNGQVLPPGTIQKIVHPYPRPDLEVLFSYYDMH